MKLRTLLELVDGKKQRRRIQSNRRKIIWYRDGKKCRYCGKKLNYRTFHVDHVLPVYHNGNDYVFNLCASCPGCNLDKGANKRIVPKKLSIFRKIYGLYLIFKYRDFPNIKDFF